VLKTKRLIVFLLGLSGVAHASTIVYNANVSAPSEEAFGISGFVTTGAAMASQGLTVIVHFSDLSTSGVVAWVTDVAGCTSASGCGQASGVAGNGTWTLTQTGSTGAVIDPTNPDTTAINPWTLTNTSTNLAITSVDIIGGTLLVFDRDMGPPGTGVAPSGGQVGTPGSAFGVDYVFNSESGANAPFTVAATYSRILTLQGAPQACSGAAFPGTTAAGCGDEWGVLTFAFTVGTFQGTVGGGNAVWSFFQDTDTIGTPEPATIGLIGVGLLALGVYRKRRLARLSN
jgi:hypothetical protein